MPSDSNTAFDDIRILVSPTEVETTRNGLELRFWAGTRIDEDGETIGDCALLVHRVLSPDVGVPGLEEREALDLFSEVREYDWVGDGPSVEEVGGDKILARLDDGDLIRGRWAEPPQHCLRTACWVDDFGTPLSNDHPPTGWRRMPKAGGSTQR